METKMQAAPTEQSLVPPPTACADVLAQPVEDWSETIAMMVASTMEPSCAFAFCFSNVDFFSWFRWGVKPAGAAGKNRQDQLT